MTMTATATQPQVTERVLTPERDLWPVVDGVLDHLRSTVAEEFPEELGLRKRVEMYEKREKLRRTAMDETSPPVHKAMRDYQAFLPQLVKAIRTDNASQRWLAHDDNPNEDVFGKRIEAARDAGEALVTAIETAEGLEKTYRDRAARFARQLTEEPLSDATDQALFDVLATDRLRAAIRGGFSNDVMTNIIEGARTANAALSQLDQGLVTRREKDRRAHAELSGLQSKAHKSTARERAKLTAAIKRLADLEKDNKRIVDRVDDLRADRAAKQAAVDAVVNDTRLRGKDRAKTREKLLDEAEAALASTVAELAEAETDFTVYKQRVVAALSDVTARTPKRTVQHQLLTGIDTAVRTAVMESDFERVKADLRRNAEDIARSGSSVSVALDVELGVAVGPDVARASATYLQGLKWTVANDKNQFTATFTHSEKLKVKGKADVTSAVSATAQGQAGGVFTEKRRYNSLEELVAKEAELLFRANAYVNPDGLPESSRRMNPDDSADFVQARTRLLIEDHQNRPALERNLQRLDVLADGEALQANPAYQREVVKTKSQTATGSVGLGAKVKLDDVFAVGGTATGTYSRTRSQDYKVVSFLDDIRAIPELQEMHATKNPNYLRFQNVDERGRGTEMSGEHAVNHLKLMEQEIERASALVDEAALVEAELRRKRGKGKLSKAKRQQLADAKNNLANRENDRLNKALDLERKLRDLKVEYDSYVYLVNQLEDKAIPNSSASRRTKNEYLSRRGIAEDNPAEYVKAISLQYAYLRRIYERARGDGTGLAIDDGYLDGFAQDLKVPRMRIADNKFRKAFDLRATTRVQRVKNVSVNVALNLSAGREVKDQSGEKIQQLSYATGLTVGLSVDEARHHGDARATKTAVLTIDPTSGVLGDNVVGQVFNQRDIKRLLGLSPSGTGNESKELDTSPLQTQCKSALAAFGLTGNTTSFTFIQKNGTWWLKSAVSTEVDVRKLGGKGTVKTGAPVDVVIGVTGTRTRKVVQREYYGSDTLAALTDVYRERHRVAGGDDHRQWNDFCQSSRLLDRITRRIIQDSESGGSSADLNQLIAQIEAGKTQGGATSRSRVLKTANLVGLDRTAGAVNDLGQWLSELATSSDDNDKQAATNFIAAYKNQTATKADRITAMTTALDTLVARKAAQEDRVNTFRTKRAITTEDINRYVTKELARQMETVILRLPSDDPIPTSIDELKKLAVADYSRQKAKRRNRQNTAASLETLKMAYGLEYAAETFEDLTEFGDKDDQATALRMLGADLKRMLKVPKVYLDDRLDGELDVGPDGNLRVKATIKKDRSKAISGKQISDRQERVVRELKAGGLDDAAPDAAIRMVSDYGTTTKSWRPRTHDPAAEREHRKALGHKARKARGREYASTVRRKGRRKARQTLSARKRQRSISAMLKKVMDARAKKLADRKRKQKQTPKSPTASATSKSSSSQD